MDMLKYLMVGGKQNPNAQSNVGSQPQNGHYQQGQNYQGIQPGTYPMPNWHILELQSPIDFGQQAEKFKMEYEASATKKCGCDIVSLMQQGCKCGGE